MAIKVGGVWKNQSSMNVKAAGSWKTVQSGWVRLSGTWREFIANTLSLGYSNTAFTIGSSGQTKSPTVSGGYTTQAKTFALVSGALPNGVTLNTSSGVLTGPGSWNFPSAVTTTTTGSISSQYAATPTSDGGVIVSGYMLSTGPMTFGSTVLTPVSGTNNLFVAKMSSTGTWTWARLASDIGTSPFTIPLVKATSDGGAIVAGIFTTTSMTFGSITLNRSSAVNNLFVAKVGNTGTWSWAIASAGSSRIFPGLVTLDMTPVTDGGVIITGAFASSTATVTSVTFGASTHSTNSSGSAALFVVKVSDSGSWVWSNASSSSSTGVINTTSQCIVAASDGGAFIYSARNGGATNIIIGGTTITGGVGKTVFVSKISNLGAWSWTATCDGPASTGGAAGAIVATNDGGAIVCGSFNSSTIVFGATTLTRTGSRNLFIAKVSSLGSWVWATTHSGAAAAAVAVTSTGLVLMPDDGACLATTFGSGNITFGSTTLTTTTMAQAFVVKISSSGAWVWASQSTNPGNFSIGLGSAQGTGMRATPDGGVIVSGYFASGSINFGSFTATYTATSPRSQLLIVKLSSAGAWSWVLTNTGAGRTYAAQFANTQDGGVVVPTYSQQNNTTFGSVTAITGTTSGYPLVMGKVTPIGGWGSSTQTGFPVTVTIRATDSSGTATTTPTLTAV